MRLPVSHASILVCVFADLLNLKTVLQDELETAMRLCGITNLEAVRGDLSYLNTSELEKLLPPKPRLGGWLFGKRARL